jgi:hypothetical protein
MGRGYGSFAREETNMNEYTTRRRFLQQAVGGAAAGFVLNDPVRGEEKKQPPKVADHTLTVIAGKPRERGRQYGQRFKDGIHHFLERELYTAFSKNYARDEQLRFAGSCAREIKAYSPTIMDELEGIAEGSGLKVEEVVLITCHEELWHRSKLPTEGHCTAFAAGPPDTADGCTYAGQTWDWMMSVYGLSSMLLWKRTEGPSVLAYAYPGLWVGAGLNAAGLAFGWTSASDKDGIKGPRVGIPAYVLLTQMLYQDSLKDAIAEVKRARHAGWFTVVLADGQGQLANLEGSPKELAVEMATSRMARNGYGSRQMTRTPESQKIKHSPKAARMYELLEKSAGKIDRATLQGNCADAGICVPYNNGGFTIDSMLFNTTRREAYVTRGSGASGRWQRFSFDDSTGGPQP